MRMKPHTGERPVSVTALLGEPGPFRYRGGVRRLLGLAPAGGRAARPGGLVPPVGFRYLDRLRGDPRVATPATRRPPVPRLEARAGAGQGPGPELLPWPAPSPAGFARSDRARSDRMPVPAAEAAPAVNAAGEPFPIEPATPVAAEASARPAPATRRERETLEPDLVARPDPPARPGIPVAPESAPAEPETSGEPFPVEPPPPVAARPAPVSRRGLESPETRPPDRRHPPEAPRPGAPAAAAEDRPAQAPPAAPRVAEPADGRPSQAQREAVWGLLERMGVRVPCPLDVPPRALEESFRPRAVTPPPALEPARRSRAAVPAEVDPAPAITPPLRAAPDAAARLDRLRRATGEIGPSEPAKAAPEAKTRAAPARRRRIATPVRQTVVVRRPPGPARVPRAYWRRRHLNLSRLWPVR